MGKTPEETKKGLERCSKSDSCPQECPYHDVPNCGSVSKLDALAYIKQLEMMAKPNEQIRWERDIAIDQLKQLGVGFGEKVEAQAPKWISVEERLPEETGKYIVCTTKGSVYCAKFSTSSRGGDFHTDMNTHVAYWMPLPEPPKEG